MTERINDSNMENRVRTFIDSVKKNVQNELSDIFDEDSEKPLYMLNENDAKIGGSIVSTSKQYSGGDIVMNLQGDRKNRKSRERCRVRKTKKVRRSQNKCDKLEKETSKTSYYTDNIQNDTTSVTNNGVDGVDGVDGADQHSMVDFENSEKNKLIENYEPENVTNCDTSCTDIDLQDLINQDLLDLIQENESCQSCSEGTEKLEKNEDIEDKYREKNEINNTCTDSTEKTEQLTVSKDLNTDNILEQIMSTTEDNREQVQTLIERIRGFSDINKDLDAIMSLDVHDKLWIKQETETVKNANGESVSRVVSRLEVHKAGTSYIAAAVRTYYGQGREDILNHLKAMVNTMENQVKYHDVLTGRSFVRLYAVKIYDAADKIESQILNQYTDRQDEIEDLINKMKTAADEIKRIHENGLEKSTD